MRRRVRTLFPWRIRVLDVSKSIKRRFLQHVPGWRDKDRLPRTIEDEGKTLAVGIAIALPFVAGFVALTWRLGFWSLLLALPFAVAWRLARRMTADSRLPMHHEWRRKRRRRRALQKALRKSGARPAKAPREP